MLRFCIGGQHIFEDGIKVPSTKISSIDEFIEAVNEIGHEHVVCKECWENTMKKNKTK